MSSPDRTKQHDIDAAVHEGFTACGDRATAAQNVSSKKEAVQTKSYVKFSLPLTSHLSLYTEAGRQLCLFYSPFAEGTAQDLRDEPHPSLVTANRPRDTSLDEVTGVDLPLHWERDGRLTTEYLWGGRPGMTADPIADGVFTGGYRPEFWMKHCVGVAPPEPGAEPRR